LKNRILLTEKFHPAILADMNSLRRLCISLISIFLLICCCFSADWPQWRGPESDGVSKEAGLPVEWSASRHLAWKAALAGLGASSPIIWQDKIIVTSQEGIVPVPQFMQPLLATDDRDLARQENPMGGRQKKQSSSGEIKLTIEAFRKADGVRLWSYSARAEGEFPALHEKHNLATPTPVTDGKLIFAWFGNGQIVALDMEGKLQWARHLGKDYGSFKTTWGHGGSPALYKDTIILLCDHSEK
jgi:outer membrane protein assembly factor BamB